jgi:hypothetical protein
VTGRAPPPAPRSPHDRCQSPAYGHADGRDGSHSTRLHSIRRPGDQPSLCPDAAHGLGRMGRVRTVGVLLASLSALLYLLFLPAYPVWGVIVIAVDVLVVYALIAHGRELQQPTT